MPRIEEMFAFVAEDQAPGDEGVVGMSTPGGWLMPLVGADMARVDSLRPMAEQIAKISRKSIKLIKFTHREELETIG